MSRRTAMGALALCLAACGDPAADLNAPVFTAGAPSRAIGGSPYTVVMIGLDNPRGLSFGPDGALYVAEAGRGNTNAEGVTDPTAPCYLILGASVCYGATGAVSRLLDGAQERIITGLPSATSRIGRSEGPNSVAVVGQRHMYIAIGLEANPDVRVPGVLEGFGQLVGVSPSALGPDKGTPHAESWTYVTDISAFEVANNPDCGEIDSNPFSLLSDDGGLLIADAGGNAVLRRDPNGKLSIFATFASSHTTTLHDGCPVPDGYPAVQPEDMVPTSIVRGPDGAYYVSQLAGFPLVPGAASVWRVEPGSAPTVFRSGFTFMVSVAFDGAGNMYVLQNMGGPLDPGGALIRVSPDGLTRTRILTGLTSPTSVVVGPDGGIYVTNNGNKIGTGQVLRIAP